MSTDLRLCLHWYDPYTGMDMLIQVTFPTQKNFLYYQPLTEVCTVCPGTCPSPYFGRRPILCAERYPKSLGSPRTFGADLRRGGANRKILTQRASTTDTQSEQPLATIKCLGISGHDISLHPLSIEVGLRFIIFWWVSSFQSYGWYLLEMMHHLLVKYMLCGYSLKPRKKQGI